MSSILNDFVRGLSSTTNLKDWKHASKIFVDDNYRLSPKYSFLFHVAFDINPQITAMPTQEILEMGMLVKSVSLPKFSVENKTYNAYNRVNIVQNKIKYDPVQITFHDDSDGVIRDFWYDYYSQYYRDSDYAPDSYAQQTKYAKRSTMEWGYSPNRYASNGSERLIQAIRIYSLHQKRFTEYVLVNPLITSFAHGTHTNGQNDTMTNTMTVAYEAVLYNYGYITPDANTDFATLHYDKEPSPLTAAGGGNNSIFGPGGLIDQADGVSNALARGDLLGAAVQGLKGFNNFKGQNVGAAAGSELTGLGLGILQGQNPLNRLNIPTLSGLLGQGSGGLMAAGAAAAAGLGLTGILGGQKGGPMTPTGATGLINLASTGMSNITDLGKRSIGGLPDLGGTLATRGLTSNGEPVASEAYDFGDTPAAPITYNGDGSTSQTDPLSGEVTNTMPDGTSYVTDGAGNILSAYDADGKLTGYQDAATGSWADASPQDQLGQQTGQLESDLESGSQPLSVDQSSDAWDF